MSEMDEDLVARVTEIYETTKPHCLDACIDPLWCIQRNICKSDAVMPRIKRTNEKGAHL